MEPTRIDIITNGQKQTLKGLINSKIVQHGIWRIDKEPGKHLCLIEITIPEKGITINFTPSDKFQDQLINTWLEAEFQNDNFTFTNPIIATKRSSQLQRKIQRLFYLLDKWTTKRRPEW